MIHSHRPIKYPISRGFTLLEIMIAILIMAIGMAAIANLQGKLTRYSTVAKQRTIAMNLAEQQIETMRSFYTMADTGAGSCSTDQVGFDDLETCANGSTVSVGNMQFTIAWTIDAYVQNADGTTEVFTGDSGAFRPDLKLAAITVSWVNGLGDSQDVELVDIIDATSIFNTGRVSARVDSNTPPRVPFNPDDFPGVVEIALGSDKLKGSTTPKPQITNKGENVITKFDVVTFLTTQDNAYLQRREEFKVANCICTMNANLGTADPPALWNGSFYASGEEVSKRTGSVSANVSGQPAECAICCKDHHDASGAADRYDSFRPAFSGDAGGFNFSGDHAHYRIVNGEKVLSKEGDDYLEACRFIRKNGLFTLTTDLLQQNLDVFKAEYPTNFNSQYSNSVINFVTDFSQAISIPGYPAIVPQVSYSVPWWLNWWGISLTSASSIKPAMSRGIYIDYINADLLKKIRCLQANGVGEFSDFCDLLKDPPWLEIMPFYDVDVTALANWNRGSSAITVTNSPISDIDRTAFSRGEVGVAQTHFNVLTDVSAHIELSNTGLTDTNPIDPDDEFENTEAMPVSLDIGGLPRTNGALVYGDIKAGSNQINIETVRVKQNPPAMSCEIETIVENNKARKAYTCDLYPVPVIGTISVSDYNGLKVTGSSTTVLNRKVCTDSTAFSGVQVTGDNTVANPDSGITGELTIFTFSNISQNVILHMTIVAQADNCP
ncbi:MAG: prepilin-type N-terminal cleavage/methylation domain-containing protein [Lysobacterales bacterium]